LRVSKERGGGMNDPDGINRRLVMKKENASAPALLPSGQRKKKKEGCEERRGLT